MIYVTAFSGGIRHGSRTEVSQNKKNVEPVKQIARNEVSHFPRLISDSRVSSVFLSSTSAVERERFKLRVDFFE